MNKTLKYPAMAPEELKSALHAESEQFEQVLCWLERHMPKSFLDEVDTKSRMLVARNLMSFSLQDCFSQINLRHMAIVMCLDKPDADLRILQSFGLYAIRYYRAFVSNEAPPFMKEDARLRIALLVLAEAGA